MLRQLRKGLQIGNYDTDNGQKDSFTLKTPVRSSGVVEDRVMPALPWSFFTKIANSCQPEWPLWSLTAAHREYLLVIGKQISFSKHYKKEYKSKISHTYHT